MYGTISAFLFSQNGAAYNIAHGSAVVECILTHLFLPDTYFDKTAIIFGGVKGQLVVGMILMAIGQAVRTVGMIQAGSNFNHIVQVERREGHTLVQHGIYRFFRHPSYFGFFWWGLGTQLVLGNVVCFSGYAFVLWRFFSSRIKSELVSIPSSLFSLFALFKSSDKLTFFTYPNRGREIPDSVLWRRIRPIQRPDMGSDTWNSLMPHKLKASTSNLGVI